MSDSATPWTVVLTLLCPWDSPGKNAEVGCHFLLQGIFLTQEKLTPHHIARLHLASVTAHCLVCGVCFSLNKSTSYLSFCLSLKSFCDEASEDLSFIRF